MINLTQHLLDQHAHSQKSRELASVLNQLVIASKYTSEKVNRAGLIDILGATGKINVQSEEVQKLDEFTHTLFVKLLRKSPYVKAVGSEEHDEIIEFSGKLHENSRYIVHIDPLDGSSNTDVNVSVGTNFVVFQRKSKMGKLTKTDYLQKGKHAVLAGYVLYGSSTMLCYSSGKGVHGFTLEPSIGEFLLSHENLTFPKASTIYSINESYEPKWDSHLKTFVRSLKKQGMNARYIGTLVADFHRNLLKGGIFVYPADRKHPEGKLRLMYEGIPFAYLAKQAGGYASNGEIDILRIQPSELHQRTPLFIGNKKLVKRVEKSLK